MNSILIVTSIFDIGGLETHIKGQINELTALGCKVHLATGSQFNSVLVPKSVASVTKNLAFDSNATINEVLYTIETLRQLIRKHKIDIVHAHPFASILLGCIAAEMEGVAFTLTLHGPASLNSLSYFQEFLFKSCLLPNAKLIFGVSEEVEELVTPYLRDKNQISVLSNGIDFSSFKLSVKNQIDHRWLIVSRLDSMKIVGITDFIIKAKQVGLKGVLIVGDGPAKEALQNQLLLDGLGEFVEFLGMRVDVPQLMQTVAGVAGMGRVALEGVASFKPVFLIGYDGVKGVLNPKLFELACKANFSGRNLVTIDVNHFQTQYEYINNDEIKKLYNDVSNEFSESVVWRKFLEKIQIIPPQSSSILSDFYRLLRVNHFPNDSFWSSSVIFDCFGSLIHSMKYFEQNMVASFFYYRDKFMDIRLAQQMSERDNKILYLTQELKVEKEHKDWLEQQRLSLQEELASVMTEHSKKMESLKYELKLESQFRESLKYNLKLIEDSRSWRITKPLRDTKQVWRRLYWFVNRFYEVYKGYGLLAAIQKTKSVISKKIPVKSKIGASEKIIKMDLDILEKEQLNKKELTDTIPLLMLVESFHDGGVERVVIDLCLNLNKKGYHCEIIVASSGGRSMDEARSYGINVIELFNNKDVLEKYLQSYNGMILTHHCYFGLDIVHKYNIQVIEVLHNAYHWQVGQDYVSILRQRYITNYVAVSSFVKEYAVNKLKISIDSIITINNGLNITGLIRPPLSLIEKFREDYSIKPRFIHVANLHPQKNHLLIIKAFAKILSIYPNAELIMAGSMDNYPDIHHVLMENLKCLNLANSVQFVGALSRRELSKFLAKAHIALLPSQLEGFSIATLEYSFFGLPTILSKTGAAQELQDGYQHVIIADSAAATVDMLSVSYMDMIPTNPSSEAIDILSNAMISMLDNYLHWQQKAFIAAKSYQEYSIYHTAQEYNTLLRIIGGYND